MAWGIVAGAAGSDKDRATEWNETTATVDDAGTNPSTLVMHQLLMVFVWAYHGTREDAEKVFEAEGHRLYR